MDEEREEEDVGGGESREHKYSHSESKALVDMIEGEVGREASEGGGVD